MGKGKKIKGSCSKKQESVSLVMYAELPPIIIHFYLQWLSASILGMAEFEGACQSVNQEKLCQKDTCR